MTSPIVLAPMNGHEWEYSELIDLAYIIRDNPVEWCAAYLGVELWRGTDGDDGQAQLVEAVFKHRRLAVASGHSTGKTYSCMVIPALWLLAHPYSFVPITGSSWQHVRSNLFPAFNFVCQRQPKLFPRAPQAHVWMLDHHWGAIGFSPLRPESVQGWHSPGGTLILVDEAAALEAEIFQALTSLLTSDLDHMLMLGNPTRSEGPFADAIRSDTWSHLRLSSENTPNCKEGQVVVPGLATVQMCRDWAEEYGENSSEYRARILGILPDQGANIFISRSAVEACFFRDATPPADDGELVMGVDVAWSEVGDETVFIVRGDTTVHHIEAYRGIKQPEQIEIIKKIISAFDGEITTVCIDATGGGSGLAQTLPDEIPQVNVLGVVGAERAFEATRYANTRTECWGRMKSALDFLAMPSHYTPSLRRRDASPSAIPVRRRMLQMSELEYYANTRGAYQLEPKDKYKERTGHSSPDTADALALTFGKALGEKAFPMLGECHKITARPTLAAIGDGRYRLSYVGMPDGYHWDGHLCRVAWIARAGSKAALWVHVDEAGSWVVLRAMTANTATRVFWECVLNKSKGQAYWLDLLSGPEDRETPLNEHAVDVCAAVARDHGLEQSPRWCDPGEITGKRGLEILDRMLLTTLATDPDAPFWKKTREAKPADFLSDPPKPQINFWDRAAWAAARGARMKVPPVTQTDPDMDIPEGLVADGGPIVRCLRLLAVVGGAPQHRIEGATVLIGR